MHQTAKPTEKHFRITLSDGRRLGCAQYGDPDGLPFMYFHGWPSSRLEPRIAKTLCADLGLQIIAPDRPGFGLSDFQPGRALASWPEDVRALAGQLRLRRFAVLGVSGGGPYAVACAALAPDLVSTALLVSSLAPLDAPGALEGMVPLNRLMLRLARSAPRLTAAIAEPWLRLFWGKGEQVIPRQIEARLPAVDRSCLANPELRQALVDSSRQGLQNGIRGAAWEGILYSQPWGFKLEEIRTPIRLWHGEKDVIIPSTMGRHLARKIPNCQANFLPEDGHFSLPFGRMHEILNVKVVKCNAATDVDRSR